MLGALNYYLQYSTVRVPGPRRAPSPPLIATYILRLSHVRMDVLRQKGLAPSHSLSQTGRRLPHGQGLPSFGSAGTRHKRVFLVG